MNLWGVNSGSVKVYVCRVNPLGQKRVDPVNMDPWLIQRFTDNNRGFTFGPQEVTKGLHVTAGLHRPTDRGFTLCQSVNLWPLGRLGSLGTIGFWVSPVLTMRVDPVNLWPLVVQIFGQQRTRGSRLQGQPSSWADPVNVSLR